MNEESMVNSTRRLVEWALEGDTPAFAALVEKYQGMVCGLALDSMGSFSDAEDIAQDTFLDAYRKLPSLRDPGKFAPWLRGITLNKIRERLRKRKARREKTMDFNSAPPHVDRRRTETNDPDGVDLRESVLRAIEKLSDEQRTAITLYYMDGRSYGDIADFLSVPVSTVKARMQGGRKRLKKEMMTMVENVLDAEKPGRELAVRILRTAVGKAKKAREKRDYANLLKYCDGAIGALEKLPITSERQKTRVDVLHWQGESHESWLASPADAITCYQTAFEIATEMGDAGGQTRALKAIILTHGRAADLRAMKSSAKRGLRIAEENSDEDLLAFCTAALDLCAAPHRKGDKTDAGGFVLGHFHVKETRGSLHLEQPLRKAQGVCRANLSLNLNCGDLARPSFLYYTYGPEQLIRKTLKLGSRWQAARR